MRVLRLVQLKVQIETERKRSSERSKSSKTRSVGQVRPFSSFVDESAQLAAEGSFDEMMEDLSEKERRFVDVQGMVELNEYKQTVQTILQFITSNSFEAQLLKRKKSSNKADFLIIRQINEKLLALTKTITSPKNKAFSLLKECEEIRGLLFDLVS